MKITVNDDSTIVLKEVYNGIEFESDSGEKLSICMRDSGFEFSYAGIKYEAKKGKVTESTAYTFNGAISVVNHESDWAVWKDSEYTCTYGELSGKNIKKKDIIVYCKDYEEARIAWKCCYYK